VITLTQKASPLSIITVCFNEVQRVELTCRSVMQQMFQDFEWIVIDGGSTDGTLDILKQYVHRMTYFISEQDRGIYHAMNKGIGQAHGTYLLFLNGGDYLYAPETLTRVFARQNELTKDIYYGDALLDKGGNLHYHSLDFTNYYARLLKKSFLHQATFIKHELFQHYGLYDETFRISADLEFFLRVLVSSPNRTRHTIERLPFVVAVYENTAGLSTRDLQLRNSEHARARKRHYPGYYLIWDRVRTWFERIKKRGRHWAKAFLKHTLKIPYFQ